MFRRQKHVQHHLQAKFIADPCTLVPLPCQPESLKKPTYHLTDELGMAQVLSRFLQFAAPKFQAPRQGIWEIRPGCFGCLGHPTYHNLQGLNTRMFQPQQFLWDLKNSSDSGTAKKIIPKCADVGLGEASHLCSGFGKDFLCLESPAEPRVTMQAEHGTGRTGTAGAVFCSRITDSFNGFPIL